MGGKAYSPLRRKSPARGEGSDYQSVPKSEFSSKRDVTNPFTAPKDLTQTPKDQDFY